MASEGTDPRICEKGGENFLPLLGDWEQDWPPVLRFILYLVGLGWCFLGVGIASDLFMGAIETITSKTKQVEKPGSKRSTTVKVWNPTVANLTLMALGSSAPEILLSIIELLSNSFFSGDLGPSTIVGSAAFNLLCIIAVCVYAIPDGESRKIEELPVYCVTATFSLFAYLWLVVILMGISPNVVEIWEGVLTFLFFPILVILAFAADKGYLTGGKESDHAHECLTAHMTKDDLDAVIAEVRSRWNGNAYLTDDEIIRIINIERSPTHSRAQHKHDAMKKIMGVQHHHEPPKCTTQKGATNGRRVAPEPDKAWSVLEAEVPTIYFESANYGVAEHCGHIELAVIRSGPLDKETTVGIRTEDGTAKAGLDHIALDSTIMFLPHETRQVVSIKIKDDDAVEKEEEFYVVLEPPADPPKASLPSFVLGEIARATVVIIDDDTPPTIQFEHDLVTVVRDGDRPVEKAVVVRRKGRPRNEVRCLCTSCDDTATAGQDYEKVHQEVMFKEGQMTASVKVKVLSAASTGGSDAVSFKLILTEPVGGEFNPRTEGGADSDISAVAIACAGTDSHQLAQMVSATSRRKLSTGHVSWGAQFSDALHPDPDGEDDDERPGCFAWFMHIIALPWKLLGALVPPADYCGGWLAFVCSLLYIGMITAIIGDLAALVGCVTTVIPDSVTAITLVALGTSLPDTFASMQAATQDPTADASIGNVTGSNSVNVFLGLGMPWTMGSLYWAAANDVGGWLTKYDSLIRNGDIPGRFAQGAFVVPAGTLGSTITVFCCCACICIMILAVRRRFGDGELGGAKVPKTITSAVLVTLWIIYVVAASAIAIANED